jgi:hypothetical protein
LPAWIAGRSVKRLGINGKDEMAEVSDDDTEQPNKKSIIQALTHERICG